MSEEKIESNSGAGRLRIKVSNETAGEKMKTLTENQKWGEEVHTSENQFSIDGQVSSVEKVFELCSLYGMPQDNLAIAVDSLLKLGLNIRPL